MIANYYKCDGKDCKNSTTNKFGDCWITTGDGGIKKTRIKRKSIVYEVNVKEGADFCSWKCLRSTGEK